MAQYSTGTIAVTNGSATIEGTGTDWANVVENIAAGNFVFIEGDTTTYTIQTVTDGDTIVLTGTVQRTTASGLTYRITRDFTANYSFPLISTGDTSTGKIVTQALNLIDTTINGIDFDQDLNTTNTPTFAGLNLTGNLDLNGNDLIMDADADSYIHSPADDMIAWVIASSEKARLNAAGFGIGTTNPSSLLHVYGSSATPALILQDSAASGAPFAEFRDGSNNVLTRLEATEAGSEFRVLAGTGLGLSLGADNSTDYVYVSTAGNVGVGTTSPARLLSVTGSVPYMEFRSSATASSHLISAVIEFSASGGTRAGFIGVNSQALQIVTDNQATDIPITFHTAGAEHMRLDPDGYLMLGTTTRVGELTVKDNGAGTLIDIEADDAVPWQISMKNATANQRWASYIDNSGTLIFYDRDGTAAAVLNLYKSGGVVVGSPTGGNKGIGTINAQAVYDDNVLLTDLVLDLAVTGEFDVHRYNRHPIAEELSEDWFDLDHHERLWRDHRSLPGMVSWDTPEEAPSTGELVTRLTAVVETQAVHIAKLNHRLKCLEEAVLSQ